MADSPTSSQSQLDCEKRLSTSQFSGSDIDSRRNILPPDVVSPPFHHGFSLLSLTMPLQISWDHDQDPYNPQNWSRARKWVVTLIVSGFAFMAPLSSSTVAPALPQIGQEFKISNDLVRQMTLSIFLLGFTFGPFILAPLSETYGRVLVIETVNCIYVIFNLVCGFATSEEQLLAFRLLAGVSLKQTRQIRCPGSTADSSADRWKLYTWHWIWSHSSTPSFASCLTFSTY